MDIDAVGFTGEGLGHCGARFIDTEFVRGNGKKFYHGDIAATLAQLLAPFAPTGAGDEAWFEWVAADSAVSGASRTAAAKMEMVFAMVVSSNLWSN
jgi:hypothetical protein